jgi:hypothetical protein
MRLYEETQSIILSMADCFLSAGKKAIYCSSELTTGLRLYTACLDHGTTDRHSLDKTWLRDNVFVLNETAANLFADEVQEKQDHPTISPAALFVPGWGQHDYLKFWDTLIKSRISEVWFNTNWQFSNGCTFEFAAAYEANLPLKDRNGDPLSLSQGLELIKQAISWLKAKGIDVNKLQEHLSRAQSF